jgi:hypothetical protein
MKIGELDLCTQKTPTHITDTSKMMTMMTVQLLDYNEAAEKIPWIYTHNISA